MGIDRQRVNSSCSPLFTRFITHQSPGITEISRNSLSIRRLLLLLFSLSSSPTFPSSLSFSSSASTMPPRKRVISPSSSPIDKPDVKPTISRSPSPSSSFSRPSDPIYYSYEIGRGEQLVLTFEPYKSFLLQDWRFKTVEIAKDSSEKLWVKFEEFGKEGDFVGMDMARKFIQMVCLSPNARRRTDH